MCVWRAPLAGRDIQCRAWYTTPFDDYYGWMDISLISLKSVGTLDNLKLKFKVQLRYHTLKDQIF